MPAHSVPSVDMSELARVVDISQREDPITILERQALSRVAELIPVRHQRMAATPFTFYRGAAAVMAADLAATPHSGVHTQLCGDAHLSNFGVFYTPERRMIFDINDFDETYPGPFEWDIKRLAASFVVAARGLGYDDGIGYASAKEVAKSYRRWMRASVQQSTLDAWYARIDAAEMMAFIAEKLDSSTAERTMRGLRKASHRNSGQAVAKLCRTDENGDVHIRSDPPLLVPIHELAEYQHSDIIEQKIAERVGRYREALSFPMRVLFDQYRIVDVARKVVGVGSVGTRCWIVLLQGASDNDPLFLQMKEAQRSVLADHVPVSGYANEGQRVIDGQVLLQAASDTFLGATYGHDENGERRDFYVRQLRDGKGSVVVEALQPVELELYARLCGRSLAHAHARTASRYQIAEFLNGQKGFAAAIADFSVAYADINDRDHAAMTTAIADGRISASELRA